MERDRPYENETDMDNERKDKEQTETLREKDNREATRRDHNPKTGDCAGVLQRTYEHQNYFLVWAFLTQFSDPFMKTFK